MSQLVLPEYGVNSIAEVAVSAVAALNGDGGKNVLKLPESEQHVILLIDGLGAEQLAEHRGYSPFLAKSWAPDQRAITSGFPSTTSTSLTSLGTGCSSGTHGVLGYDVFDPDTQTVVNQLGQWPINLDPYAWQPRTTVFEKASAQGIQVVSVGEEKFQNSGLTRAGLRGSSYLSATSEQFVARVAQAVAASPRILVYAYWGELDRVGHAYGVASQEWRNALEECDFLVRQLSQRLPHRTQITVTADHGMVDVPEDRQIWFRRDSSLLRDVMVTAGEPRAVQLQVSAGAEEAVCHRWRDELGDRAWVVTKTEAVTQGWFGLVDQAVMDRAGDILIAARDNWAFFDGSRLPERMSSMRGHHGSLTRDEVAVPLISLAGTR